MLCNVEEAVDSGSLWQKQWHSSFLARLWLHENSHAVVNAALPSRGYPRVFIGPGAKTSEDGFEVEARIFGGQFKIVPELRPSSEALVFTDWPDWARVKEYKDARLPLITKEADPEEQSWQLGWEVEQDFIERMFRDSFWTEELTEWRLEALRPKKLLDWIFKRGTKEYTADDRLDALSQLEKEGFTVRTEETTESD
jgi:hypothetical protein